MKKNSKSIVIMVSICSVMALLLAITNSVTAPMIEKNQQAAANEALLQVMPQGTDFQLADISSYTLPDTVKEVYKEASGGYVITLVTAGYASDMNIMCGIQADGTVTGAICLSSNETLGKEKTYGENFAGKTIDGVEEVDTVTGATKTTQAYKNAIKDALNTVVILGGGSVDLRTEEEILADHLAEVLPQGEGKFTKLFIAQELETVTAIYVANNGKGFVCVSQEEYIGLDEQYQVISPCSGDEQVISTQVKKANTTTYEEINVAVYPQWKDQIVSAKKTNTGNYVLQVKGAGYGIQGGNEYHPASGEYIVVQVAITPQGNILDCLTVSQMETQGVGSVCAEESFYGQFRGKNKTNYTQVDAIGGATITTNGYLQAVGKAFDFVAVLEGGSQS